MPSRRDMLRMLGAGVAASSLASLRIAELHAELKTALKGTIGLQLWSLRKSLPGDLAGTLGKIKAMGFDVVEGAGLWKHTVADLRAALDTAGLKCQSAHIPYERLEKDRGGAFAEAKAMGASWVVCPWIPHEGETFTPENVKKAADLFNAVGKDAAAADLHFAYHCHGYEFFPAGKIDLFDELVASTDPKTVSLQIDVFHALLGGHEPASLIVRHRPRITSLHLKDLKKDFPIKTGTAIAPAEADVPLGTGQVDMPAVLREAAKAGVMQFYIEDESDDPLGHIPQSVKYLQDVKL